MVVPLTRGSDGIIELEAAYRQCRIITRREAKNFYYAFITLPPEKRRAIYATYAFCRLCDDAADEPLPLKEKLAALQSLRHNLALIGCPDLLDLGPEQNSVFSALADASTTYQIPREYFKEVVAGVEMDLTQNRYQDFEELRSYCYRVASAVGLICIQIFGYRHPSAREYAIDLGVAMQLTNILRDAKEDLERDRVYIPLEEIESFGYSVEELKAGVMNEAFQELMAFQTNRACEYFQRGLRLLPLLSPRSRACPAVLSALYRRILSRIEASNFNIFDGKVGLSGREKLFITAQTWLKSILPISRHNPT